MDRIQQFEADLPKLTERYETPRAAAAAMKELGYALARDLSDDEMVAFLARKPWTLHQYVAPHATFYDLLVEAVATHFEMRAYQIVEFER